MGTDPARRNWLGTALLSALQPLSAATVRHSAARWVGAWSEPGGHRIGRLCCDATGWSVIEQTPVPTRAHGLLALPDGSVLAVARRPGDWLMRWHPRSPRRRSAQTLAWAMPHRQFNGHACLHPDGQHLLVTETDTQGDLGQGHVTQRHLDRLDHVLADWPTQGRDPHHLLPCPDGRQLWVANGGLPSRVEMGRTRVTGAPMDASIVAIDLGSGQFMHRWSLDDAHLSLRHLAWHGLSATLGVAMQAEHTDAAQRQAAPVLALLQPFDPDAALRCAEAAPPMAGYGGDICATPEGFVVSSPRASLLGGWTSQGRWTGASRLDQACALASTGAVTMAAGSAHAAAWTSGGSETVRRDLPVTLDNHWLHVRAGG